MNNLIVSFFALSDPDVANIFSALHVLFDIEWAYGLRTTMKDGKLTELKYYLKEIKIPMNSVDPDEEYTV